jgi:hypothetical protein
MNKESLQNSITRELKIVRRLLTKIPTDQMNFRPKENVRSTLELLQYLCSCGTSMIRFWYRTDGSDMKTFFTETGARLKTLSGDQIGAELEKQIKLLVQLFDKISEEDLLTKEVDYPWGTKAPLGEAIIETCVKWTTAYKLQLFMNMKLSTDEKLTTPDLWRKTELEEA